VKYCYNKILFLTLHQKPAQTYMTDRAELKKALAVLEAQRAILGDAVVDAAIAPIRERLAALEQGEQQARTGAELTELL
jgi:hypothetical protein